MMKWRQAKPQARGGSSTLLPPMHLNLPLGMTPLLQIPLGRHDNVDVIAKRHYVLVLIQDDDFQILPTVLNHLGRGPDKEPLNPFLRQYPLDVEVQRQHRVPKSLIRSEGGLLLVAAGPPPFDDHGIGVRDVTKVVVGEPLARPLEAQPQVHHAAPRSACAPARDVELEVVVRADERGEARAEGSPAPDPAGVAVQREEAKVAHGSGRGRRRPPGGERQAPLEADAGVGDVGEHVTARAGGEPRGRRQVNIVLVEGDVYRGHGLAELHLLDDEDRGPDFSAPHVFEVGGDGVWLSTLCEVERHCA